MGYDFELMGETSLVHPLRELDGNTLAVEGQPIRARLSPSLAEGEYFLDIDGHRETIFIASQIDTHYIHFRGRVHRIEAINALERARRAADPSGGDEILRAPMPGTVVGVGAREGAIVELGALLLTIESMKLQTAITAPRAARVAEVFVTAGATFDQGDPLVRLEEPERADEPQTDQGESSK